MNGYNEHPHKPYFTKLVSLNGQIWSKYYWTSQELLKLDAILEYTMVNNTLVLKTSKVFYKIVDLIQVLNLVHL